MHLQKLTIRRQLARTHNMQLSEILKKGGLVVNQRVVLLMKCVQVQFFATQESGLYFKDEEAAAKAYLYFAFFEKEVITKAFSGNAFITYMSREEEFALPDLPIIRLYSMKSGLRTRPWFVYNS